MASNLPKNRFGAHWTNICAHGAHRASPRAQSGHDGGGAAASSDDELLPGSTSARRSPKRQGARKPGSISPNKKRVAPRGGKKSPAASTAAAVSPTIPDEDEGFWTATGALPKKDGPSPTKPPAAPPDLMVAALLPRTLALAGAESSGALLGLVTPADR